MKFYFSVRVFAIKVLLQAALVHAFVAIRLFVYIKPPPYCMYSQINETFQYFECLESLLLSAREVI